MSTIMFLSLLLAMIFYVSADAKVYYQHQRTRDVAVSEVNTRWQQKSDVCKCESSMCSCCLHLDIPRIGLNDSGCVNLTYLPEQYGISLTFSIDGHVIINQTISARNPPPVCFGIPGLKQEASLCIELYNLNFTLHNLGGCVRIDARLYHVFVERIDLGCFYTAKPRTKWQRLMDVIKNKVDNML